MSAAELAREIRRGAGLIERCDRALLEVTGADRVRWLQGQISNDVPSLVEGQGCYATVLTVKGRIVADVHVLARAESLWLEMAASVRDAVMERLERYIVADDVVLTDVSARFARLALEGPAAAVILCAAAGETTAPEPEPPEPESARAVRVAGADAIAWAFGTTGLPALQLFVPPGSRDAVRDALVRAGAEHGLVPADADALEILRVESGVPATGAELDEEVFPAEARLQRAISTTKGCYTGQEIVERIRSRGGVNYLLVGLRFDGAPGQAPPPGTELTNEAGKRVGEVTSVARSAEVGAIGLGYVRRELETPGTVLHAGAASAVVAALPFVGRAGGTPGAEASG